MTTYLRKTKSYTKVSTRVTESKISIGAIGLLTLILSNQDSYVIYKSVIQKRAKVGKKQFAKYWKELEAMGFVKEIMTNKGRINYEYIIVNDPTDEASIETINQLVENRRLLLVDGELVTENNLQNTVDDEKDTNISLNNKDLNNENLNNVELTNSNLAISETPLNIEELKKFWYQNINNKELSDLEEKEILSEELFVSVLAKTVSTIIKNKSQFEEQPLNITLKSFYYVFGFTVRDWKYTEKSFNDSNISDEVISFIQKM